MIYPLLQFDVFNTLITGYAEDVIMGEFSKDVALNYKFDHSILLYHETQGDG